MLFRSSFFYWFPSHDSRGYEGWGNVGMKPSHEPIAFCRKPIEKGLTVAENCLKWGTGGINIDISKIKEYNIEEAIKEYLCLIKTLNKKE